MLGVISMAGEASTLPEYQKSQVSGKTFRLIPSHYPPIGIFEDLLDPEDLDMAYLLESITNDRISEQAGNIRLVPLDQRMVGQGTTPIMAAFTHIGIPSRFTNGQFGVYDAGLSLETALAESMHSRTRFLKNSNTPATRLTMRCYSCKINTELVDVRENKDCHSEDWTQAQALAVKLRKQGDNGVQYNSLRHEGGINVAIFKPNQLIPPANQSGHYEFIWDGSKISNVLKLIDMNIGR
jgi:hypothetical protein